MMGAVGLQSVLVSLQPFAQFLVLWGADPTEVQLKTSPPEQY